MKIKHDINPSCSCAFVWTLTLDPETRKLTRDPDPVGICEGATRDVKLANARTTCELKPTQAIYLTTCYKDEFRMIEKIKQRNPELSFADVYRIFQTDRRARGDQRAISREFKVKTGG